MASDLERTISYLSSSFSRARESMLSRAYSSKGDKQNILAELKEYETELCYLIDDIQRGHLYLIPKRVSDVNILVRQVEMGDN